MTTGGVKSRLASQVPFLDTPCNTGPLIAAVIASRCWTLKRQEIGDLPEHTDLEFWLRPLTGCRARSNSVGPELPECTDRQHEQIGDALRFVIDTKPHWASFFQLPVRFLQLPTDSRAISSSAPHWPQHIMLAPAAFASDEELREQVVHEFCHQWLYLLEEVCPLEKAEAARDLTLPSGTTERSAREVIGAAHVGLALADLYDDCGQPHQAAILRGYATDCLTVLDEHAADLLTDEAVQIIQRMRRS
ncbi:aKG-HExxH-type peptide beta-hydroxylase [Nocardia sp. NPDC003482]